MSEYWVYILECTDGTFYTGIATDVERRFEQHQEGTGAKYTRAHGAKRIVYTENCGNRSNASKKEAAIKKFTRQQKIALIEQNEYTQ